MKNTSEKTTLHYIKNSSTTVPIIRYSGLDESQTYSDNYTFLEATIINARALSDAHNFSLDKQAFKLVSFKPTELNFGHPERVKQSYYPKVEDLVKRETGASHVFAFDHTVRRGIKNSNRHPAYHVHNDYTYESGLSRAAYFLGDDVINQFGGKRMIQINVWRSIAGIVEQDPLALMDATTLDDKDLVKTEIQFNDMNTGDSHDGEIFALKQNSKQRWYFYPEMNAEEAILIKGFDTDSSYSCFAMHSAFPLAGQGEHNKPRQSIETRTYAFYDA